MHEIILPCWEVYNMYSTFRSEKPTGVRETRHSHVRMLLGLQDNEKLSLTDLRVDKMGSVPGVAAGSTLNSMYLYLP